MQDSTTLTGSLAAKLLRTVIKDYNFWGQSESDSPLKIRRTKYLMDDARIISLDASARTSQEKTVSPESSYKAPERNVRTEPLEEVFKPLVANALAELQGIAEQVQAEASGIESMEFSAEQVEYYVQLYSAFNQLANPRVCYVEDAAGDPYTGLFIIGEASDGETVYAQSLLIQT